MGRTALTGSAMFLKVIACEIAFREICHLAARSRNLIDLEFLTQGHHDRPAEGRAALQERIDQVPEGRYDAILVGYGLCGSVLPGLRARHTSLVVPRAHDCITFFLGSKERYRERFEARPGTYYFSSGWLECRRRRGLDGPAFQSAFLPATAASGFQKTYEEWVRKYGEEKARYLAEAMGEWSAHYSHGTWIDFEFLRPLNLAGEVREICSRQGWQFEEVKGDLGLLQRWIDGEWSEEEFLRVPPGRAIRPAFDERIIELDDGA
ncbi:MAG: DUF1638 domain-containing protein [Verrucomicrobia bacterium]|nr:MAG: DUF1638 domain-containing protein [Verrucomicrobiota bacterium]